MKIILSRKGFDSSNGGRPSPIMPDGRLVSLPIPERDEKRRRCRYGQIGWADGSLGTLVHDLTGGCLGDDDWAHLDPDLVRGSLPRTAGWKPLFGQSGAAESHLRRRGVGAGDLFLFFGWFRPVERSSGRFRYLSASPGAHLLYGWLQIEQRLEAAAGQQIPGWARKHAHVVAEPDKRPDALYVAADRLSLPGYAPAKAGGGVFDQYRPALRLTAPGQKRSLWRLPAWFAALGRDGALTYHGDERRWSLQEDGLWLQSASRGQEFVLDAGPYPQAIAWAAGLLGLNRDSR